MNIRFASEEDTARILEIYSYYIENTAVLLTDIIPGLEEYKSLIAKIQKDYPVIVAEEDNLLIGYAYAKRIYDSKAYDFTVESTIYLDNHYLKKGIGSVLYSKLEEILKKQNVISVNAYISVVSVNDRFLDDSSRTFHTKLGYEEVSYLKDWGYKFNRWYDCIWMRKFINPVSNPPKEFISIEEIRDEISF